MWARFHHEVSKHPKTKALAETLNIPLCAACGLLACLWSWAVENADADGNISGTRDKRIERECCWNGEQGALIPALLESGWLDGSYDNDSLCIHDWMENGGASLQQSREKSAERQRRLRERKSMSRVTVTRDCNAVKSQSQNKSQSIDIEPDIERNPFVISDKEKSITSTSSITSGDARGLYAYFKQYFPNGTIPNFSTFKSLLAKGFDADAVKRMIDMTADAGADYPAKYFETICEDKAKRGLFTLEALEADESTFARQQRSNVPPAIPGKFF